MECDSAFRTIVVFSNLCLTLVANPSIVFGTAVYKLIMIFYWLIVAANEVIFGGIKSNM